MIMKAAIGKDWVPLSFKIAKSTDEIITKLVSLGIFATKSEFARVAINLLIQDSIPQIEIRQEIKNEPD